MGITFFPTNELQLFLTAPFNPTTKDFLCACVASVSMCWIRFLPSSAIEQLRANYVRMRKSLLIQHPVQYSEFWMVELFSLFHTLLILFMTLQVSAVTYTQGPEVLGYRLAALSTAQELGQGGRRWFWDTFMPHPILSCPGTRSILLIGVSRPRAVQTYAWHLMAL